VKVSAQLFAAGLADPRGGVYRKVEIFNLHNDQDTVQTHAWLFPGETAVCWNGLVYRVKSAGAVADLETDVQTVLSAKPWSGRMPTIFRAGDDPDPAPAAFWSDMQSNQTIVPTSISLLLRLERADLAEKLWAAPEVPTIAGNKVGPHETEEGLWLATAATAWFATAYWRLVFAFGAGNDLEAADVGESILEWRSRVPDAWRVENRWVPKRVPDISFLNPVPQLTADARRRLKGSKREDLDLKTIADDATGVGHFSQQPQAVRVAQLIDRLEDMIGSKISYPGPLVFSFAPAYKLLVREGDAAVIALIDAYENDERLTRTFDYSRPWNIAYTPIAVHQVVELLLGDVLGDNAWKGKTPAELQSWWRERHSTSRAERSFQMLADDRATHEQWLESADFLTTRSDLQRFQGGFTMQPGGCDPGKSLAPPNGESFRTRANPSMTELLQKRAAALANLGSSLACVMSVKLALWDEKAALPSLRLAAKLQSCRANPLIAIARLSVGDETAASDWVAELPHHAKFPPLMLNELAPFWIFPQDPVLEQAAQSLFEKPDADWSPVKAYNHINSPLIAVPAFRRAALTALHDSTVVARFTQRANGYLSFSFANGGGGSFPDSVDPRAARGEEPPIRAKDLVAWGVSNMEGAPEFGLDWTTAEKDAALPVIGSFLESNGADLHPSPSRLQEMDCGGHISSKPSSK